MQLTLGPLTIAFTVEAPLVFTPAALPNGLVGTVYPPTSLGLVAGGIGPYVFALDPGGIVPDGMAISSDGMLSGTPTTVGTADIGPFHISDSGTP